MRMKKYNLFLFLVMENDGAEPLFLQETACKLVQQARSIRVQMTGRDETSLITIDHVANYFGSLLDADVDYEWEFVPAVKCKPREIIAALELNYR